MTARKENRLPIPQDALSTRGGSACLVIASVIVAVAGFAVTAGDVARAQGTPAPALSPSPDNCNQPAFVAVVERTGATLRKLNRQTRNGLVDQLRAASPGKPVGRNAVARAMRELNRDPKVAAFDMRIDRELAAVDDLGDLTVHEPSCKRLALLTKASEALLATMQAKRAYLQRKFPSTLAARDAAAPRAAKPTPAAPTVSDAPLTAPSPAQPPRTGRFAVAEKPLLKPQAAPPARPQQVPSRAASKPKPAPTPQRQRATAPPQVQPAPSSAPAPPPAPRKAKPRPQNIARAPQTRSGAPNPPSRPRLPAWRTQTKPNAALNRPTLDARPLPLTPQLRTGPQTGLQTAPQTGPQPSAQLPAMMPLDESQTFSVEEISAVGKGFFGSISVGLANVINYTFQRAGRPNGYILGREGGGAFLAGIRFGKGEMVTKAYGSRPIYWRGPTIGYDVGATGSRTMILVYNLKGSKGIFRRFTGVDGSAYLVGGIGVTFLTDGNVVLAPIRSGLGLRLGANIGYLKFRGRPSWNPF